MSSAFSSGGKRFSSSSFSRKKSLFSIWPNLCRLILFRPSTGMAASVGNELGRASAHTLGYRGQKPGARLLPSCGQRGIQQPLGPGARRTEKRRGRTEARSIARQGRGRDTIKASTIKAPASLRPNHGLSGGFSCLPLSGAAEESTRRGTARRGLQALRGHHACATRFREVDRLRG